MSHIIFSSRSSLAMLGLSAALLASPFASAESALIAPVPDLSCEIEQMIIAGDRVVVHLHFRGHFSGTFKTLKGQSQRVDFRATDIYQIDNGRIAANWHIEDNISLLAQLQAQPPAS